MLKVAENRDSNMTWTRKQKILFLCVVFLALLIGIELRYLYTRFGYFQPPRDIAQAARDVVAACAAEPYAPSCYDNEIPKLMDRGYTMEESFAVTRLVQEQDPRYLYCHVLGHNLSYKEAERHLSDWKDIITRCPSTMCNNGCLHGALMRRFNAESLTPEQVEQVKPDLQDVCEPRGSWNPTEVEISMCYHALGHLAMYMTNADITKAVDICTEIGEKPDGRSYYQTCVEGVLMQLYQPLEPEDVALVAHLTPKKDYVDFFCKQFSGETYDACHRESWPLFLTDMQDPPGLVKFCSYTQDKVAQRKCYGTAFNILAQYLVMDSLQDLSGLERFCTALPLQVKEYCYANTAFRVVQIDPILVNTGLEICALGNKAGVGDACYESMLHHSAHSFHANSPALATYCATFPDHLKMRCLAQDAPVQ